MQASATATRERSLCRSTAPKLSSRHPEPSAPTSRTPPFTTTQFHVLLNSLFKVLFNFPSRYLFAIGLGVIFSLTWSLPRTLSCTPKQLDSREKPAQQAKSLTGLSPSTYIHIPTYTYLQEFIMTIILLIDRKKVIM